MKPFRCLLPAAVEFGPGKVEAVSGMTAGRSVLLLSDPGVAKSGIAASVADLCGRSAASVRTYADIPPEPTEDQITEIAAALGGKHVDVIVAVGGGSVIDAAKLLSVMLEGGPTLADMFEGSLPARKSAELVALPNDDELAMLAEQSKPVWQVSPENPVNKLIRELVLRTTE